MEKQEILLNQYSDSVQYLIKKDKRFGIVVNNISEISYTLNVCDPYVFLVDTIVGQMLSKKVATIICKRIHDLCNNKISPENIHKIKYEEFRNAGVSNSKIEYINNLTSAVLSNSLNLTELSQKDDEDVMLLLRNVRGIGSWSAKMFLIFVLNRPDVLPFEDGAFLQSYAWLYNTKDLKPSSIKKRCKKWSPYSSIAARFLYKALDEGLTKTPFNQFS